MINCSLIIRKKKVTMTDHQGIERHFTKMAAIGRSFQLGDLYDYRSDNILTGKLIKFLIMMML